MGKQGKSGKERFEVEYKKRCRHTKTSLAGAAAREVTKEVMRIQAGLGLRHANQGSAQFAPGGDITSNRQQQVTVFIMFREETVFRKRFGPPTVDPA